MMAASSAIKRIKGPSRGKRDYMFRRGRIWYFKFRYPDDYMRDPPETEAAMRAEGWKPLARRIEESLHTEDEAEAQAEALKRVAALKKLIWQYRATVRGTIKRAPRWKQEPGSIVRHDDGSWSIATETEIRTYDRDDKLIGKPELNSYWKNFATSFPIEDRDDLKLIMQHRSPAARIGEKTLDLTVPKQPKGKSVDSLVIEAWVKEKNVRPEIVREAERTYDLFRELTGKTFSTARSSDVKRLAFALYEGKSAAAHTKMDASGAPILIPRKSATVKKMIGHLRAAVNVALEDDDEFPTIRENAFTRSIPTRDDEDARDIMDDDDMARIYEAMPSWPRDVRVLVAILAATGMRRGEVWDITGERKFDGYRCVNVGTKTPSSDRMVILTQELIDFLGPDLPTKIEGPLFTDDVTPKNLGKQGLRYIRDLGITDPNKVLHSLRHRASTRLNGCQDSERDAILGHDDNGTGKGKKGSKVTASQRYFKGHPAARIAELMTQIGLGAPGSIPTAVFLEKAAARKAG